MGRSCVAVSGRRRSLRHPVHRRCEAGDRRAAGDLARLELARWSSSVSRAWGARCRRGGCALHARSGSRRGGALRPGERARSRRQTGHRTVSLAHIGRRSGITGFREGTGGNRQSRCVHDVARVCELRRGVQGPRAEACSHTSRGSECRHRGQSRQHPQLHREWPVKLPRGFRRPWALRRFRLCRPAPFAVPPPSPGDIARGRRRRVRLRAFPGARCRLRLVGTTAVRRLSRCPRRALAVADRARSEAVS